MVVCHSSNKYTQETNIPGLISLCLRVGKGRFSQYLVPGPRIPERQKGSFRREDPQDQNTYTMLDGSVTEQRSGECLTHSPHPAPSLSPAFHKTKTDAAHLWGPHLPPLPAHCPDLLKQSNVQARDKTLPNSILNHMAKEDIILALVMLKLVMLVKMKAFKSRLLLATFQKMKTYGINTHRLTHICPLFEDSLPSKFRTRSVCENSIFIHQTILQCHCEQLKYQDTL